MLGAKQRDLVGFSRRDGFLSLSEGTVRSGKTFGALVSFAGHTLSLTDSYKHLILGRKLRVIEAELLPTLRDIVTGLGGRYRYRRSDGMLEAGGQRYFLVAGNDVRSADRVTGLTCHSALIDEATLLPEGFWDMGLGRLSFPDSKAWATCNPGPPTHWLKEKWIDAGKLDQSLGFTFEDNPTLTTGVIERYRSTFSGVFRKRMVDGLWAAAEGLIFQHVRIDELDMEEYVKLRTVVGVDYGITNPTSLIPLTKLRHKRSRKVVYYVPGDTELKSSRAAPLTDDAISDAVAEVSRKYDWAPAIIPPDAASLRAALVTRRGRRFPVRKANNAVLPGIRLTDNLLHREELVVSPRAARLIREMNGYVWDDAKPDVPLKENDHHVDALRYAVMNLCRLRLNGAVQLTGGL